MRITRENLDQTVKINVEINKEIEKHIAYVYKYKTKYDTLSAEKQAVQILKENYLIQIPIPDLNWGERLKNCQMG